MTMIEITTIEGLDIAVVNAEETLLKNLETAGELFRSIKTQGETPLIAINAEAFPTKFFDPDTGFPQKVLGALQDHDMKMAVVGDFNAHAQTAFLPFMAECNNGFHLFFVADEDTAFRRLQNAQEDDRKRAL